MDTILECVPNFSEGRDKNTIRCIADSIARFEGVRILHVDMGAAANRTVITFAGRPLQVVEAAYAAIETAFQHIDMRVQTGAHPRIGAVDVCPLVPVHEITMQDAVILSHQLAHRVGSQLHVPVYLYAESARLPARRELSHCRSGQYEKLEMKLQSPEGQPDEGPAIFPPRHGACVIGARKLLVAYNINIESQDVELAREIAWSVRESGRPKNSPGAELRLPAVRALGWYLNDFGRAQVSMNLVDVEQTPLHVAWEAVCRQAERLGTRVTGSELIGLVPENCLEAAGRFFSDSAHDLNNDELIDLAVSKLNLNELYPFRAEEKILERALHKSGRQGGLQVNSK